MKTKLMLGALIMAALIASSVGVGYAGGGAGGSGPGGAPAILQCYEVLQGSNPPHILSINDQFTDATPETLGKPKLLCTFASWDILNPTVAPAPVDPVTYPNGGPPDHITCYEVSQAHATPSVVILKDVFGVPQKVKVQGPSKYVCVAATKECLSGCPVIGQ